MRICYIALGKFPHVDPYLDFFSKRGHDVHFVALTPGYPRSVPTHYAGGNGAFFRLCGKSSYLPAILRARKIIRRLGPDIVHAHYATSAGLAAYVCGVHPWVVTGHGTDVTLGVQSLLWRNLLRQIFRKADCVNPVSDGLQQMVARLGIPAGKIETRTFGIDTQRFGFVKRPLGKVSGPLSLVSTRWFEPVYDHATILKSMAILKTRNTPFHLTLIGEGSLRGQMLKLADELGLRDQVTFAGAVPNASLPEQLARHDTYLSASTRDGTSLSLLEAMAVGLYPVVSDIPANSEWISHGQNGLLHQVQDPHSLADCLVAHAQSADRGSEALLRNRQLVLARGDRAGNMERMEQTYHRLILAQGAPADSISLPQGAR